MNKLISHQARVGAVYGPRYPRLLKRGNKSQEEKEEPGSLRHMGFRDPEAVRHLKLSAAGNSVVVSHYWMGG